MATPTPDLTGDRRAETSLPLTLGPYVPGLEAGGLLFLSGQTGKLPGERRVEGSIRAQTVRCLRNLIAVLASHDLDDAALVKCNVFLVDMDDFAEMNDAYEHVLIGHRPARTTIAVSGLPLGARVEIEAIAATGVRCDDWLRHSRSSLETRRARTSAAPKRMVPSPHDSQEKQ